MTPQEIQDARDLIDLIRVSQPSNHHQCSMSAGILLDKVEEAMGLLQQQADRMADLETQLERLVRIEDVWRKTYGNATMLHLGMSGVLGSPDQDGENKS